MKKYFFVAVVLFSTILSPQSLSPTNENQNTSIVGIEAFVGDWVGSGWGWEIRFKQTSGDFIKQLAGSKAKDIPFEGEKHIMTLMVTHVTQFYFSVDESGQVTGKGSITYGLIPNLCGLSALTKQVNEAVNMMSLVPTIFRWGAQISTNTIKAFNREWYQQENKLATSLSEFSKITKSMANVKTGARTPRELELSLMQWYKDAKASDDVVNLASTILFTRCGTGSYNFGSGVDCSVLGGDMAISQTVPSLGKELGEKALRIILKNIANEVKKKLVALDLNSQMNEQLCLCGAGVSSAAGTRVGPATLQQLILEFGPDIAKAAFFEAAVGSPPVGLLLSIPGVTQVQYYYKGLKNGPEIRSFDLTGNLTVSGGKPELKLELDGDVYDGDKNLAIEYMVNYKKENPTFPTWSPFLKDAGKIHEFGKEIVRERKTVIRKEEYIDKVTGEKMTVEIPEEITIEKEIYQDAPFATFEEAGSHRNNVKVWQEYEYFWNAHKLTEPKDTEEPDDQSKSQKKEIEDRTKEIEQTGRTSFDVEFESGKESVTPNSKPQIKIIIKVIEKFPQNKFLVAVFSDSLSDKILAGQRANFIINELMMNGVSGSRITALGSDKKTTGEIKQKKFIHTKVDLVKK
ncbi:MAG: hypothetical protein WBQ32_15810 [Ignavibacteriaceae bacterium]